MKRSSLAWYITGFCDGEAWFQVRPKTMIDKRYNKVSKGFSVLFAVQLRSDDYKLLKMMKKYFGVGNISTRSRRGNIQEQKQYSVYGVKNNLKVIEHFDKYPLQGKKKKDYQLFREIVMRIYERGLRTPWDLDEYLELVGMCDDLRLDRLPSNTGIKRTELLRQKGGSTELYLPKITKLLIKTGELKI